MSRIGEVVPGASEMRELQVYAFSTVFVEGVPPNAADNQVCAGVLDDVDLSLGVVAGLSSGLNSSSAAGPDGLHLHMLKA